MQTRRGLESADQSVLLHRSTIELCLLFACFRLRFYSSLLSALLLPRFFFSFRISQVRIAGSHLIIFYQWKWDSPLFRRFAALHVNICNHETKQGAKFGIRRPRFRTLRPCWNTDTLVSNCLDVISIWCSWIVDSWPVMRQTSTFAIFLSAHLYMRSVYLPQQGETYFVIPFSNSDFSVIK